MHMSEGFHGFGPRIAPRRERSQEEAYQPEKEALRVATADGDYRQREEVRNREAERKAVGFSLKTQRLFLWVGP